MWKKMWISNFRFCISRQRLSFVRTIEPTPAIRKTMSDFQTFLQLGIGHIADLAALDHILFILTLCAIYRPEAWKQILILVTAFTLGHSLTLALAGLDLVNIPAELVEKAIPITIIAAGAYNFLVHPDGKQDRTDWRHYALAAGFGLIHGMGFANYFRSLMMAAGDEIVLPLFAFNLGIELGQIGIVLAYFLLLYLAEHGLGLRHPRWATFLSGMGTGGAFVILVQQAV